MKNTTYWFSTIVIANILFIRFYFHQDIYRIISFIAFLVLIYAISKFPASIAQLFIERDLSDDETHSENPKKEQFIKKKATFITVTALLLLTISHVWAYSYYFKLEKNDLSRRGIYAGAVVTDKRLESRSKNSYSYYIYYSYKYNGKVYLHNCLNNTIEIGDTIIVKFSPENPDHHLIMDKMF